MIEGIKIELSSEDLKRKIKSRLDYHNGRVAWYDEQVKSLETGLDPSFGSTNNSYSGNSPVESLKQARTGHLGKIKYFELILECLVPNETYRLGDGDIAKLELAVWY